MRLILVSGLLAALLYPSATPAAAKTPSRSAPACRLTPSAPRVLGYGELPTPTARCDYDIAALHRRINRLVAVSKGPLGPALLERIFSLPPMGKAYDDPESADHVIRIEGAGGWSAQLWAEETAAPTAPISEGSPRPTAIGGQARGTSVSVSIKYPESGPGSDTCRTDAAFLGFARRLGWREQPPPPDYGFIDGPAFLPNGEPMINIEPPMPPARTYERGRIVMTLSPVWGRHATYRRDKRCFGGVGLEEEPR